MSTVTYIGDEPREVAILPDGYTKVVQPDEKFNVPDEFDASYACQPHFFEVKGMTAEEAIVTEPGTMPPDDEKPAEKPAKTTTTKGK